MYEKMDGKGIHLWFLQSVRQSPGQAVFQPTCFQTSWDARGGLGTTIFEGICLLGTISTKTLCLHLSSEKKKKNARNLHSPHLPFHSIPTFIPGRDAGAQNISTGQMTKGCQLQTWRRLHPYVAQRYLRKAQKSGEI